MQYLMVHLVAVYGVTEHPNATHSLPESVHMLVCSGISLSLYMCSLLLIRMHIHDVYNAAPACIIYSYSCPSLCIHTYTLLLRTYSTTRSSSLCMCTHILLLLVYYTVHAPYHHYVVLCHILHISMCAPKYIHTYTYYRHNMSSDMSSYHLIIYDTMYHHLRYLLHGMLCHYTLRSIYATLPPYLYTQIPWYGVSIWTSRPPSLYRHILRSIESMESMESRI